MPIGPLTNVAGPVNTTITGTQSLTTVTYAAAGVTGTADAATLTLVGTATGSGFSTSGIETLTIASTGSANTLTTLTAAPATITITGSQALTTGTIGGAALTTVNAAAATGALTITTGAGTGTSGAGVSITAPTAATGTINLTAGANNDTIVLGAGAATVVAGAGNDTITAGAGVTSITPGAGLDTINLALSTGIDTIRFDNAAASTNGDTINGFDVAKDVLSFSLGSAVSGVVASSPIYGVVQTGALASTVATVAGTGTGTGFTSAQFSTVAQATATANTIPQTAAIVALSGYTDGTATGVVTALGVTGTTGVTTTAAGKFLLVTYSVGNIAQVWSYAGDTTVDTNINADELTLVATLNGIAANSLTAANFGASIAAAAAAASGTVSNVGQTIALSAPLNTVTATANANGFFTSAASDTITAGVGALPTGSASTTQGLVIVDASATDSDVFNATVLNTAWNVGSILTQIETVNLAMLVADTDGMSMTSIMPGTTALNLSGTQGFGTATGITDIAAGTAFGLGANSLAFTGQLRINATAGSAMTLNLNTAAGTTAALSGQFTSDTALGTLTVNVNTASSVRTDGTSAGIFNGTASLAGANNLTIFGTAAQFAAGQLTARGTGYTGALTLRPSTTADMDFSASGVVTGIRTLDLSDTSTVFANTVTFTSTNNSDAYGSGAITIGNSGATNATMTSLTAAITGGGTSDALTVSLGSSATGITGALTASTGWETVSVTSAAASTVTTTIGGITLSTGAGNQTVNVSGAGNFVLGTVTADTISTTGVTGTVSLTLANGAANPVQFTGGAGATIVTGTTFSDIITTGAGADSINLGTLASSVTPNLNGGAGNDTYSFTTTSGASNITDSAGTDTLLMTTAGNTTAVNGGVGTLLAAGLDQFVITNAGTMTVAPSQFAGGVATFNTIAAGGSFGVTLATAGALNLSGVVGTAGTYLSTAGVSSTGIAVTAITATGSTGVDTITGPAAIATSFNGGGGLDTFAFGTHTAINTAVFGTAAAANAITISGFSRSGGDILSIKNTDTTTASANPQVANVFTLSSTAVNAANEIVLLVGTTYATAALAETALDVYAGATITATDDVIFMYTDGTSTFVYKDINAGTDSAGTDLTLIATLTGISTAAALAAFTSANFAFN